MADGGYVSVAEKLVAERIRKVARTGDLIRSNLRVTDDRKDAEIDVLLAIPGAGFIVVEVKGGQLTHDGSQWWQSTDDGGWKAVDPVGQARTAKYLLRTYVERDPRWGHRGRVRWAHAVVAPYTRIEADFALPDCPRSMIFGRNDLDELVERLAEIPLAQESANREATNQDVEILGEILRGRALPQADLLGHALERDDLMRSLTEQQGVILDVSRLINRLEIRGGAGSGKTWLAIEQARRLTREGQQVALLCYSRGLATYLDRVTRAFGRRGRPAYVGTFHNLGVQRWKAPEPAANAGPEYWEETLPQSMIDIARELPDRQKFDSIVVDEAQDFAPLWWDAVLAGLKDPDHGGLYLFNDTGQRVFARRSPLPECTAVFVLEHNLRNTRQIFDTFDPLNVTRMRHRGGQGPDVTLVPCSAEDAVGCADDQVDLLLDAGWRPEDIAVLTTGSRHPEHDARLANGTDAYWASFWDTDQVFYGHVLGFKGLERKVVVLAGNGTFAGEGAKERLYVGLSRATDQLIVCGDPEQLKAVGGQPMMRRLTRSPADPIT